MNEKRAMKRISLGLAAFSLIHAIALIPPNIQADTIYLKNGLVLQSMGAPDKDETLVFLWDGIKRTVIRDSKIERIVGDNAFRTGEKFQLVQPLTVHAGAMPKVVLSVEAGPWDEKGRRSFHFTGSGGGTGKSGTMEQAINEIGPHVSKFRGVNGFWVAQTATSQIPREIVVGLLSRVDQSNQAERERAVRFLMDAGWYAEATKELDRMIEQFPDTDLAERSKGAKEYMIQAEATQMRGEIEVRRRAQQFREAASILKTLSRKELNTELQLEISDQARVAEEQDAADLALANDIRKLADKLSTPVLKTWKPRLTEMVKAIEEVPDAVRDRFSAYRKARSGAGMTDENRLALAMSGYVAGAESSVPELKDADTLWQARDLIHAYLASDDNAEREGLLAELEGLEWPADETVNQGYRRLELASRVIPLMKPPLAPLLAETEKKPTEAKKNSDKKDDAKGTVKSSSSIKDEAVDKTSTTNGEKPKPIAKTVSHRLDDGGSEEPAEYLVRIPPEYHPLRSYPAVVVLHSGKGPASAIESWSAEAARRGYFVIAPQYQASSQDPEYHYSPNEHAAVELAIRDAQRRYSIDSDRVFLAGQLVGGNMAWDFSLAHPDLFAGAIVISGLPAKYVPRYLPHHDYVPLYFVLGELAPAATEVVFPNYIKPMIQKVWDVTYVEYQRRGLEELPEEIPPIFDWMDKHRRDPAPRSFETVTARSCDNRFFGVVVHEFTEGRSTAPEAVEMLGQNLSPATLKFKTSTISNMANLKAAGLRKLDFWISPRLIDFKRKIDIRLNDKSRVKGAVKLTLEPLLEDLRIRGDRKQLYWMKVSAG